MAYIWLFIAHIASGTSPWSQRPSHIRCYQLRVEHPSHGGTCGSERGGIATGPHGAGRSGGGWSEWTDVHQGLAHQQNHIGLIPWDSNLKMAEWANEKWARVFDPPTLEHVRQPNMEPTATLNKCGCFGHWATHFLQTPRLGTPEIAYHWVASPKPAGRVQPYPTTCQALYKYSYATRISTFRSYSISEGQRWPWNKKCQKVPWRFGKNLQSGWCRFLFTTSMSFFKQTFYPVVRRELRS